MRRPRFETLFGLVLLASALPVVATAPLAATTIKLATLVPDGSVWDKALKEMGSEWGKATDGRVALRIYPGGVAGDEPDVVRKMRIGQLHAGTLTVGGLTEIDDYFSLFNIPLFFDSYEELFHVLEELEPVLTERLEAKGFVFLNWGHAGWIHLFSKQPIEVVDDLRAQKLFVWAGQDRVVQWWKRNDYQPVALAATDILTGLQTGMIEVLPTTPLVGLSLQWFRQTPYMLDVGLAPLVGVTVVTRRAWQRISEADRAALRSAAQIAEERLEREVPEQDATAIEEMAKRGLTVVSSPDLASWRAEAEKFSRSMRDGIVPAEIVDRALAARDAFRSARDGGESP